MVIQNNLIALNALRNLNNNVINVSRATERLASGLRINRASDDAAGLAISEKMRSQIRGLSQAIRNAKDGISLIQTAEGGLNETHAILQRIRELAVQSSNGTYKDELDRQAIQLEVDALLLEIDRIAHSTEFNKKKLLDGSLAGGSGNNNNFGASFGIRYRSTVFNQFISISSSIADVTMSFNTMNAKGGETAEWSTDGKNITLNLAAGQSYTDSQINDLIGRATRQDAGQTHAPAKVEFKSDAGIITAANYTTQATVAGIRQTCEIDLLPLMQPGGTFGYANQMRFTANQYGSHTNTTGVFSSIRISTAPTTSPGKERVTIDTHAQPGTAGAAITLHLATGTEYSSEFIEGLLRSAGFDYTVQMQTNGAPGAFSTAHFNRIGVAGANIPNIAPSISPGSSPSASPLSAPTAPQDGEWFWGNSSNIPATQTPNTPVSPAHWQNISGKNLNWLRDYIADTAAPEAMNIIMNTFGFLDFFRDSNISMGLTHANLGGAAADVTWGVSTAGQIQLRLRVDTQWINSLTNASGGFVDAAAKTEFDNIIIHEMIHGIMAVTNTAGMINMWSDEFPLWFIEGMAQAASGPGNWVRAGGGLNLNATSSDTQIRAALQSNALTNSGSGAAMYGTSYLATMYLGWMAAGGGAVTSANIAVGLNKIMGEITNGKSLNQAIADNTKYSGLTNFQSTFHNDTDVYDFVRTLLANTGTGVGSVLAPLNQTPVLSGTPGPPGTFIRIDVNNEFVQNNYPPGYNIRAGGGANSPGNPVHPSYDPFPALTPVLSGGTGNRTGNTTATVSFTSNSAGAFRYLVLDAAAPPPTAATILSTGTAGTAVEGSNTLNITGINTNAHRVYMVMENAQGVSEILEIGIPEITVGSININTLVNGMSGAGWNFNAGVLTITDNGNYEIIGTGAQTSNRIVVNSGVNANISLNNVNINNISPGENALNMGGATVNLDLIGTNTLRGETGIRTTGGTLTINGTGTLNATGTAYTGIGGYSVESGGTLIINGGNINAHGAFGAGIGGGGDGTGHGGNITINGGTVTATSNHGTGIGGGVTGNGGNITINNGNITATGGGNSAGIGGRPGGTITINGGNITATGAAIGGIVGGAGIGGSGEGGHGGNITITGGTITATGGSEGAGIGGGQGGNGGNITISGGTVTATGGTNAAAVGGGGGNWDNAGSGATLVLSGGDLIIGGGGWIGGGYNTLENDYAPHGAVRFADKNDINDMFDLIMGSIQDIHGTPIWRTQVVGVTFAANTDITYTIGGVTHSSRTDASGNLYLYLPTANTGAPLGLTISGTNYGAALSIAADHTNIVTLDQVFIPPVLTAGTVQRTDEDAATVRFTSNGTGDVFYIVRDADDTTPLTAADIKTNGTSMSGSAGQNIINLTGIDPASQRIFIVQENADGFSNILNMVIPVFVPPGAITDGQGLGRNHVPSGGGGLILQIGANGTADQRVTVSINNMSAGALGVSNVNVSTQDSANRAISTIDIAISKVSMQRASLGAMQNRLESTINSLTNYSENLTAAESRIRDADMAQEMIKYAKYTILQQAAMAMLTQAMQMPQGVLQLLQ
jgi:flagellin